MSLKTYDYCRESGDGGRERRMQRERGHGDDEATTSITRRRICKGGKWWSCPERILGFFNRLAAVTVSKRNEYDLEIGDFVTCSNLPI